MTFEGRLQRRALCLALAAVVGCAALLTSPASVSADPVAGRDQTSIAPADPLLDEPQKGAKAAAALGDDLPVAADRNDLGAAELRSLLRTDETAWVDTEGLVFFVDPAPEATVSDDAPTPARAAPLGDTFRLHSNPGAQLTILLDFDGAGVSGTAWNAELGVTPGTHPAWDPAGDGPTFSDNERLKVQQVWAMVAEDYAPFNVDVTTEDVNADRILRSSSADNTYGTRVLISPSDDPFAKICGRSCGGVAYINVFAQIGGSLQPAWVFPQALGNNAKSVAEAASHEAGHNLALQHDGTSTQDYYTGHGIWAPIMGVGYNKPLVQWSAGSYGGANNQQDDIAILTGILGARPDEASASVARPSPLPDGERIIGSRSDVDAYLLGACTVGSTVQVSPAAVAPNLDVRAVLYDAAGVQQSISEPTSSSGDGTTAGGLGADLTVPGAGDGWVLTVEGVGQGAWGQQGYDDYGSLGAYTVDAPGCDGNAAQGAPSEPVDVRSGTVGHDTATISWSAPATAAGGPVTGYVVTRSGSAGSQTLGAGARSHTFTGLAPGTTYQLSVRAINAVGAGRSVTISTTTAQPTPAAPSAPQNVTGSYNQALEQIEAYWTEPLSAGTQPITDYAVYLDNTYLGLLPSTSRGVVITNPVGFSEGEHVVGVAAINAVGSSPTSTVRVAVALPNRPANDDLADAQQLSGPAGSVQGDNTHATRQASDPEPPTSFPEGGFSVWYSWTPTSDGPVQLATSGGGATRDTTLAVYSGQPGSLVQIAGNDNSEGVHARVSFTAEAGTRYLVAIDGFSYAGGSGPFTLAWDQKILKAPAAPLSVMATRGDRSAVVSWTAPDDNGSPITSYEVEVSPGGAKQTVTASARATTVSGLTNGTAYSFTVRAVNAVGSSPASPRSDGVSPAGVPGVPTLQVVRGDTSVRLSWSAPAANGEAITGYTIGDGTRVLVTSGSSTSLDLGGLINGQLYRFTVSASNGVGESAPSAAVAVIPSGVPQAPARPTAKSGKRHAKISWRPPSANGAVITSYRVRRSDGAVRTVKGSARSYSWTGLKKGKKYSFTIYAINQMGTGKASRPSARVKIT